MLSRSILFVCTGNTCRSPMAAALFRHMLKKEGLTGIEAVSRGVHAVSGQPMSEGAVVSLRAAGLEPGPHQSQALTAKDVRKADEIRVMTEAHRRIVLSTYPEAKGKVSLLGSSDIDDPLGGSPNDYEKCRIDIQNALIDLLAQLKRERTSS